MLVADQRPPCTLMAPGACKIRRGCNVLQVPCQKIPLGVPWQSVGLATCQRIKIVRPVVYRESSGYIPDRRQKPTA